MITRELTEADYPMFIQWFANHSHWPVAQCTTPDVPVIDEAEARRRIAQVVGPQHHGTLLATFDDAGDLHTVRAFSVYGDHSYTMWVSMRTNDKDLFRRAYRGTMEWCKQVGIKTMSSSVSNLEWPQFARGKALLLSLIKNPRYEDIVVDGVSQRYITWDVE